MNLSQAQLNLLRFSLPLGLYGKGKAKEFDDLLKEIESGDCQILWEENKPIRVVEVISIEVFSHCGQELVEDRQQFKDGRIRRREMKGISEKKLLDESPIEGAYRAMLEELNLKSRDFVLSFAGEAEEKVESPSYPGLFSYYKIFRFRADISQSAYCPTGYQEAGDKKTTYFIWKKI